MIETLYKKFNKTKLVLSILMLAVYIAGTVLAGGKIWHLPLFVLGCCVYIFLPGRAIYHLLDMDNCFPVNGRFHSLYYVFGMAFLIITYIGGFIAGNLALKVAPALLFLVSAFTVKTKQINGPKKTTADNSQLVLMFLLFSFPTSSKVLCA